MLGNVWEWCTDDWRFEPYNDEERFRPGSTRTSSGLFFIARRRTLNHFGVAPIQHLHLPSVETTTRILANFQSASPFGSFKLRELACYPSGVGKRYPLQISDETTN